MNSRAKGARGEREWANVLRLEFPALEFRRGLQSRGGGAEVADVEGLPGYHQEVKRVEKLNVWRALAQAERDADPGLVPIVPFRRNGSRWYVAMPAEHFFDLIQGRGQAIARDSERPGNGRIPETAGSLTAQAAV